MLVVGVVLTMRKEPLSLHRFLLAIPFVGVLSLLYFHGPRLLSSSLFTTHRTLTLWNSIFIGLFLLAFYFFKNSRAQIIKGILLLAVLFTGVTRVLIGYNYGLGPTFLIYGADTVLFFCACVFFGKIFLQTDLLRSQFFVGLSGLTLLSVLITATNINSVAPTPLLWVHPLLCLFFLFQIWKTDLSIFSFKSLSGPLLFALFCYFLPVLPSLFSAGPSDADITTIAEMMGFHFQGVSLLHATTGLPLETLHIRYPAGLSSLAYVVAWFLNLRTAEPLFLLWFGSYALHIVALLRLSQHLRINSFLVVIFSISFTLLEWQGFAGGQVQEQLAYALGIYAFCFFLEQKWFASALLLSAGALIQPMVILPFGFALGATFLMQHFRKLLSREGVLALLPLLGVVIYFFFLNQGAQSISQPALLLSEITPHIFFSNILLWFSYDTSWLFPWLLIIPVLALQKYFSPSTRLLLGSWLLGVILLDGFFGHTHWAARNHAGFSVVGLFALCPSLLLFYLEKRGASAIHLFRVQMGALILWLIQLAPLIPLTPHESFFTRDDIKLGRKLTALIPQGSLIMNATGPGVDHYYAWTARGNSAQNTIQMRIGDHQLAKPTLLERKLYTDCVSAQLENTKACLANLGVQYLWVSSQNMTPEKLNIFGTPLHQVGMSSLFKISD